MSVRDIAGTATAIQAELAKQLGPPEEGRHSVTQSVVLRSLVRGTRGYIERVVNQINGAYENGWYDACAVMLRRLLETIIIEAFEHHKIAAKIRTSSDQYCNLSELIDKAIDEQSWNIGRDAKKSLTKLREIGNKSAHGRRFTAHRGDIEVLLPEIRNVLQEFLYISHLK